ncbi:HNH endonuclease [Paenibacillus sp. UNCCL117]|nr:HNH endonuclease [Paenibacillus sp. cl123]SFW22690.1 HNH endonuclease [Paenibacillus sp. UNCCL117]
MEQEPQSDINEHTTEGIALAHKQCAHCQEEKPLTDFLRRSGRRGGKSARRGTCRACRKLRKQEQGSLLAEGDGDTGAVSAAAPVSDTREAENENYLPAYERMAEREERSPDETAIGLPDDAGETAPSPGDAEPARKKRRRRRRRKKPAVAARPVTAEPDEEVPPPPKIRIKRPLPLPPPRPKGPDASVLRPNRDGILWMRGRTDKGRRWQQETDLETAVNLVREHAAIVVNKHTVRRIYTNKMFRLFILTRDRYTCHFCGEYGDTIDHIVPRAKGGHTTPVNCVCACNECNQMKADQNWEDFIETEPSGAELESLSGSERDQASWESAEI